MKNNKDIFLESDLILVEEVIYDWKCPGCWSELKEGFSERAPKCPRCNELMLPVNGRVLDDHN